MNQIRNQTTESMNSSSSNCPHCGKVKPQKTIDLLGIEITVTPSCQCEIEAYEADVKRMTDRQERERQGNLLKNSGLVGDAQEMTLDRFIARPGTEKALAVINDFVENFEQYRKTGEGIVLVGDYGNGKSHLAAAVVHQLVGQGIPASFQPVAELLKRVRATYGGHGDESEIMDLLQGVRCLVLDDVGAQKHTEWAEEFLYTVIDYRYRNMLPTIITSNCEAIDGEKSLTQALGGRSVDRILERNVIVKVTATSRRREVARARMGRLQT